MKTLAERLSWARENKKLTQTQLANLAFVSQSTIGNLEAGIRLTSRNTAALAKVLGVNALWLETGKGKSDLDHIEPQEFVSVLSAKFPKKVEEAIILMMGQDDIGLDMCLTSIKKAIEVRDAEKAALPRPSERVASQTNISSPLQGMFDDLDPDKYVDLLPEPTIQNTNTSGKSHQITESVQEKIAKSRKSLSDRVNEIIKGESRPPQHPEGRKGGKK